jgi:type VI secretion system protein ImpG
MLKEYYNQEIRSLREDAKEFARHYPSLAPMLAGQSSDPDVERLLEGVAYLTGMLHEKLDDELPEIIYSLAALVFPHYLRPIPAVTLMEFRPKPGLKESITIRQETQIASKNVQGTSCLFRTTVPLRLHPLCLTEAGFTFTTSQAGTIRLAFELQGIPLDTWNPEELRLCLHAGYPEAADLLLLLCRNTESILITPEEDGEACRLGSGDLQPAGINSHERLIPFSDRTFSGYRMLQEYFLLPQKFLFINICNLQKWQRKGKGNRFTIEIRLGKLPFSPPVITRDTFLLHVVPAINLFRMDAEPLTLDLRQKEYPIYPSREMASTSRIFSVDSVNGIRHGEASQREFVPFRFYNEQHTGVPVYEIKQRTARTGPEINLSIEVTWPEHVERYTRETLSIALTCSNGDIAELLGPGEICEPTSTSPELATFRNITIPTTPIHPHVGKNLLWHFLSHLSLNFLSIATTENIKSLLNLYLFPEERNRARLDSNKRKVAGISSLEAKPAERLVRGLMMRGTEITITLDQNHFSSTGDIFLFGSVLDYFLGVYSSINSYTRLTIEESVTGKTITWKPRLGDRFLI